MTSIAHAFPSIALGFGVGMSLIVAIGAQNAFVLRQGVRREHVLAVVAICAASDAVLIIAGIAGLGAAVQGSSIVLAVLKWVGAAFLITYGVLAAMRAIRPKKGLDEARGTGSTSLAVAVTTCLALTWLNPHVYLDTVVLLGSIANNEGNPGRWFFGAGAAAASVVWFAGLGFGARMLRGFMAKPSSWRILDGIVAAIMLVLGVLLVVRG